jgi:hypothetical protein
MTEVSGATLGGRPRLLGTMLCVPRLGGGGEEQVSAATLGPYIGCGDLLG